MSSKSSEDAAGRRRRRRSTVEIKAGLRALSLQLALLNRGVSGRLALREIDMDCFDLVSRNGPLGPSALARQAGVRPATLTGILDRLETAGWISRDRDPDDRRAVRITARPERHAELLGHFAGMNTSLEQICSDYDEAELALLAGFLHRTAEAGQRAAEELGKGASAAGS